MNKIQVNWENNKFKSQNWQNFLGVKFKYLSLNWFYTLIKSFLQFSCLWIGNY